MTGEQSRKLEIGSRVYWGLDQDDYGTVIEKTWSGVVIKWHNRDPQLILHNDMLAVSLN